MLRNLIPLKFLLSLLDWLGGLDVIVLVLSSVEASRLKILHRLFTTSTAGIIFLQISNHSLVTGRVKRLLGTS